MSASNWTPCPRCSAEKQAEKDRQKKAAQEAYGKVPVEEFDRLRAIADEEVVLETTVREDYEFYGFDEGKVIASYAASCQSCGLSLTFRDEHDVPGLEAR